LYVSAEDTLRGQCLELDADLVVLSTGIKPSQGTVHVGETLGIELGDDLFVKEKHQNLKALVQTLKGSMYAAPPKVPKISPIAFYKQMQPLSKRYRLLVRTTYQ